MPEGPEAKRIADQLSQFRGYKIRVEGFGGRYATTPPDGFKEFADSTLESPRFVTNVNAKGKFLYWELDDGWSIWNTLGMSGTYEQFPKKHAAMNLNLSRYSGDVTRSACISFVDARHFGTLKFVKGRSVLEEKLGSMMFDFLEGPKSATAIWWYLRDCRKGLLEHEVSIVLMNQNVFPGIGNYLRAEILYASKVSPWRLLKDVTYDEFSLICANAHEIMTNSYRSGGATIATYRDANGEKGQYTSRFAVYGRKADPQGLPVVREKTPDGRTIHWCPTVQK